MHHSSDHHELGGHGPGHPDPVDGDGGATVTATIGHITPTVRAAAFAGCLGCIPLLTGFQGSLAGTGAPGLVSVAVGTPAVVDMPGRCGPASVTGFIRCVPLLTGLDGSLPRRGAIDGAQRVETSTGGYVAPEQRVTMPAMTFGYVFQLTGGQRPGPGVPAGLITSGAPPDTFDLPDPVRSVFA